jgi:CcmD family protein
MLDDMTNLGFLFAAYSITWIVLFGYLFVMWRKQNRLEKGMQQLQEKILNNS